MAKPQSPLTSSRDAVSRSAEALGLSDERACFRQALTTTFERAATDGRSQHWLSIGHWRWQIESAGPGASVPMPWLRALAHLRVDPPDDGTRPDLCLRVWDQATTGIGLPACPWPAAPMCGRGDIEHGWGSDVQAVFSVDSQMLQYLDAPARFAVSWMRDPARLRPWEHAAPLRSLWAGWARAVGGFLVHAAGAGISGDGVLLTGPSGSGKSTTALACLARGMSFAGDDFVMLARSADGVNLHAVFSSAKIAAAELNGELLPPSAEPALSDGQKAVLWIHDTHPTQMARQLRLRALIVPVPTGRLQPLLRRATPVELMRALLPSSAFLTAGAERRAYAGVMNLVADLPAFVLELASDRGQNAAMLEDLLRGG